jgi:hypothetical protein
VVGRSPLLPQGHEGLACAKSSIALYLWWLAQAAHGTRLSAAVHSLAKSGSNDNAASSAAISALFRWHVVRMRPHSLKRRLQSGRIAKDQTSIPIRSERTPTPVCRCTSGFSQSPASTEFSTLSLRCAEAGSADRRIARNIRIESKEISVYDSAYRDMSTNL